MAEPTYTLLDGTTAAIDFTAAVSTVAGPPVTAGPQVSFRCFANYITLMFRRGTTQRITFCDNGWSKPIGGMRQGFGHIDGFMSKGGAPSDPLALFTQNIPMPFLFTADTGLTFTGSLIQTQEMDSARAFAEMGRGIDFETYGAVSTLWVVT